MEEAVVSLRHGENMGSKAHMEHRSPPPWISWKTADRCSNGGKVFPELELCILVGIGSMGGGG